MDGNLSTRRSAGGKRLLGVMKNHQESVHECDETSGIHSYASEFSHQNPPVKKTRWAKIPRFSNESDFKNYRSKMFNQKHRDDDSTDHDSFIATYGRDLMGSTPKVNESQIYQKNAEPYSQVPSIYGKS
ncbi:hypothetical protein RF11_08835 [Thelohanellus kitauei]|uniref:Uncharacterized protein n=1 Tax=Thelohanellus kitauei TaxID=669202 RepID=A0A0C2M3X6_THEKT|nr:hypothetical protein RF11_08835 [Thelohanellus kitauei]